MADEKLLTALEVCQLLRMPITSFNHIYSMAKQGKIPKPIKVGRRSLWREKDILDWLKSKNSKGGENG